MGDIDEGAKDGASPEAGHANWTAASMDWNPLTLEGWDGRKRRKVAGGLPCCSVPGCTVDLSQAKPYFKRHMVCATHMKMPHISIGGAKLRYCQQCGHFENLDVFVGANRSCKMSLERRSAIALAARTKGKASGTSKKKSGEARDQARSREGQTSTSSDDGPTGTTGTGTGHDSSERADGMARVSSLTQAKRTSDKDRRSGAEGVDAAGGGGLRAAATQTHSRDVDMAADSADQPAFRTPFGTDASAPSRSSSGAPCGTDGPSPSLRHLPAAAGSGLALGGGHNGNGGGGLGPDVPNATSSSGMEAEPGAGHTGHHVFSAAAAAAMLAHTPLPTSSCPLPSSVPGAGAGADLHALLSHRSLALPSQGLAAPPDAARRFASGPVLPGGGFVTNAYGTAGAPTAAAAVGAWPGSPQGVGTAPQPLQQAAPRPLFSAATAPLVLNSISSVLSSIRDPGLETQLQDILASARHESSGWYGGSTDEDTSAGGGASLAAAVRQALLRPNRNRTNPTAAGVVAAGYAGAGAGAGPSVPPPTAAGPEPMDVGGGAGGSSLLTAMRYIQLQHGAALPQGREAVQGRSPQLGGQGGLTQLVPVAALGAAAGPGASAAAGVRAGAAGSGAATMAASSAPGIAPALEAQRGQAAAGPSGPVAAAGGAQAGGELLTYRPGEPECLVRMSLKLTSRAPDELDPTTVASLRKMLSVYHNLQSMQGFVRPGCTQLVIDAVVSPGGGFSGPRAAYAGGGGGPLDPRLTQQLGSGRGASQSAGAALPYSAASSSSLSNASALQPGQRFMSDSPSYASAGASACGSALTSTSRSRSSRMMSTMSSSAFSEHSTARSASTHGALSSWAASSVRSRLESSTCADVTPGLSIAEGAEVEAAAEAELSGGSRVRSDEGPVMGSGGGRGKPDVQRRGRRLLGSEAMVTTAQLMGGLRELVAANGTSVVLQLDDLSLSVRSDGTLAGVKLLPLEELPTIVAASAAAVAVDSVGVEVVLYGTSLTGPAVRMWGRMHGQFHALASRPTSDGGVAVRLPLLTSPGLLQIEASVEPPGFTAATTTSADGYTSAAVGSLGPWAPGPDALGPAAYSQAQQWLSGLTSGGRVAPGGGSNNSSGGGADTERSGDTGAGAGAGAGAAPAAAAAGVVAQGAMLGPAYPLLMLPSAQAVEELHGLAAAMGPTSLRRFVLDAGRLLDAGELLSQPVNGIQPVRGGAATSANSAAGASAATWGSTQSDSAPPLLAAAMENASSHVSPDVSNNGSNAVGNMTPPLDLSEPLLLVPAHVSGPAAAAAATAGHVGVGGGASQPAAAATTTEAYSMATGGRRGVGSAGGRDEPTRNESLSRLRIPLTSQPDLDSFLQAAAAVAEAPFPESLPLPLSASTPHPPSTLLPPPSAPTLRVPASRASAVGPDSAAGSSSSHTPRLLSFLQTYDKDEIAAVAAAASRGDSGSALRLLGGASSADPSDGMTNGDDEAVVEALLGPEAVGGLLEAAVALLSTTVERRMATCTATLVAALTDLAFRFPHRLLPELVPPPRPGAFGLMHAAARAGDGGCVAALAALGPLLGEHVSLEARGPAGVTPLHLLALLPTAPRLLVSLQKDHPGIAQALATARADDGLTPLQLYEMLHMGGSTGSTSRTAAGATRAGVASDAAAAADDADVAPGADDSGPGGTAAPPIPVDMVLAAAAAAAAAAATPPPAAAAAAAATDGREHSSSEAWGSQAAKIGGDRVGRGSADSAQVVHPIGVQAAAQAGAGVGAAGPTPYPTTRAAATAASPVGPARASGEGASAPAAAAAAGSSVCEPLPAADGTTAEVAGPPTPAASGLAAAKAAAEVTAATEGTSYSGEGGEEAQGLWSTSALVAVLAAVGMAVVGGPWLRLLVLLLVAVLLAAAAAMRRRV
ncbi:hypothetical protein HYH03_014560 [Edaphochlamys debaryana]|uniref:SBP-type domain-containing protein n=1 Tax=Edaphochlamys debaryana TaxID=47281 RepID=A0A836BRT5_9CHLO|nr:hypothetical protein HYH03_014560 [Edaphochlamys debaryana]|eukprot:KAG2486761.1 hypothetical protein HYH03_014560 [Edaphochlamys debaryana]